MSPESPVGSDDQKIGCESFRSARVGLFIGLSTVAAASLLAVTYVEVRGRDDRDRLDEEWRRKLLT